MVKGQRNTKDDEKKISLTNKRALCVQLPI